MQPLNMDFSEFLMVPTAAMEWVPSPQSGVDRKPLERQASESGRATSVVRYASGASFPTHSHPRGEEFLVLEGVFSDQWGDYGPGTYVRNPPGSAHAPFSRTGCVILVKLCQMGDRAESRLVIDSRQARWQHVSTTGRKCSLLFKSPHESVALEEWAPGTRLPPQRVAGGEEIWVLSGQLKEADHVIPDQSWMRLPAGYERQFATDSGCRLWVKRGHLAINKV